MHKLSFSPKIFQTRLFRGATLCGLFLLWLLIALTTMFHHEYWRDEIRALSVALSSPDYISIPNFIKNEGHPSAWYFILRVFNQWISPHITMPALGIVICGSAILIFLSRSPFPLRIKTLFVFSILPLYEYSVMVRNYGISMLLLFFYAALYKDYKKNLIGLLLILLLLANTNLPALIVSGLLVCLLVLDLCRDFHKFRNLKILVIAFIFLLAAIFSLYSLLPDNSSLLTDTTKLHSWGEYSKSIIHALIYPGEVIVEFLAVSPTTFFKIVSQVLAWALIFGLINDIRSSLLLFFGFLVFGFINHSVYFLSLRHQGILISLIIVLYWIQMDASPMSRSERSSTKKFLRFLGVFVALPFALILSDVAAIQRVYLDIKLEMSSSKTLGAWLSSNPEYDRAIIIGDPPYILEALPYYTNASIYMPREGVFKNYSSSTMHQQLDLSIDDILSTAIKLKAENGRPVIVILGWPPSDFDAENLKIFPYHRKLKWTKGEWKYFRERTSYLGAFNHARGDENYYLYLVE